tara:strand:- start:840197 stop:840862 length:666 start_codon:yes stop_codon:yes gene_type:complete
MKRLFKKRDFNKNYPAYWLAYERLFSNQEKQHIQDSRFVVLDTETTGFDTNVDRVLSIGAIEIYNNQIDIASAFEVYLKQKHFNSKTVEIHGIIKNERFETLDEKEAIEQFLRYIGNAILVAHHANFDITMLNKILERNGLPKLKNKVLDTVKLYKATRIKSNLIRQGNYSLDEIADTYMLDVSDRHTAAGDAFITAIIFLKTTSILSNEKKLSLKQLFKL